MGTGAEMAIHIQWNIYCNRTIFLGRMGKPVPHGINGYFNRVFLGYKPEKSTSSYAAGITTMDGVQPDKQIHRRFPYRNICALLGYYRYDKI